MRTWLGRRQFFLKVLCGSQPPKGSRSVCGAGPSPPPGCGAAATTRPRPQRGGARSLIIGSQNLTTTSLLENRELSLALDSAIAPTVIAAVSSTFDADYTAASAQ
jgi:hypothetical protein